MGDIVIGLSALISVSFLFWSLSKIKDSVNNDFERIENDSNTLDK